MKSQLSSDQLRVWGHLASKCGLRATEKMERVRTPSRKRKVYTDTVGDFYLKARDAGWPGTLVEWSGLVKAEIRLAIRAHLVRKAKEKP